MELEMGVDLVLRYVATTHAAVIGGDRILGLFQPGWKRETASALNGTGRRQP
jgi:hypothetical protein